jgi:Tol biopolymer transport system component
MAFQRFTNSVPRNYLWPLPAGPETEICKGCLALLNWTADGRSLVISEGEPNRLMAFDVATGQRTLVASHPKYSIHDGSLSPDKRWIMFKLITSPTAQPVFIAPVRNGSAVPETEWVRITGDYYHQKPFWSPDGALVYYYSTEDNFNCLYARRLQPATKQPQGPAVAVQHFHGALRPAFVVGYGIAPDRLYIPMVSTRSDVWLAEPGGTR